MNLCVLLAAVCAMAQLSTSDMPVAQYPSDKMQYWHKTLYDRLLQLNRDGHLASLPFCRNEAELETNLTEDNSNLTGKTYLELLRSTKSSVLNVSFDIGISQIVEVNERFRTITLKLLVAMFWVDCRLTWSLEEYPIEQLHMSNNYFRKLDIYVPHLAMLEELEHPSSDAVEYIAEIWSSYIALSKRYTTTVSCNIDVSMYPLDTQFCNLTFESVLEKTIVTLMMGELLHASDTRERSIEDFHTNMGRYIPNDAWEVRILGGYHVIQNSCLDYEDETSSFCQLTDTITHTLLLRRHPTYQLVNLMLPAFLIVVISSCVFLIPPGSSDKMSLSLTSLLSLFIFTQIMYNKMPETGETLPLLSQYFLSSVALVSLSCVASSISVIFERSTKSVAVKTKLPAISALFVQGNGQGAFGFLPRERRSTSTAAKSTQPTTESKTMIVEVRRLAKMFDHVFFVFHLMTSFIVLIIYVVRGYIPWKNYGYRNF